MPYPNWIAARMKNPKQFEKFRSEIVGDGIMLIYGIKDNESTVQAYRFAANKWTIEDVEEWLAEKELKPIKIEAAKKTQSFKVNLQCYIQELSPQEIKGAIPSDVYRKIREKDAHPLFRAYSICHEGISRPKLIGENKGTPIKWTRAAVRSIQAFISKAVNFFNGHNEDNSTTGRRKLGEVVGNMRKEIGGKLHHIVVGYFPPHVRGEIKNLTVPSMEAVWNFVKENGQIIANSLDTLTGIALGTAGIETPAFSEATLMGAVQAFEESDEEDGEGPEKPAKRSKQMTKEDVKQGVNDLNIWPSQIFTVDKLKQDHEFRNIFEEPATKIKKLEEENETLKKSYEELEKQNKELSVNYNRVTVKDKFDTIVNDKEKNFGEKEKNFIVKNFDLITDFTDDGIVQFVENQSKFYQERVAPFIESDTKTPQKSQDKGDGNPWLKEQTQE
jgi:hypothetical protein